MDVFNPKILDASIRDVSSCLSDNQKAELLLYAMKSLPVEGPYRTHFENAIQSCLQVTTLPPETIARAHILRAKARLNAGALISAQADLQAALAAEPDNAEAKALLHQRSVGVEMLLSPVSHPPSPLSIEIWREIFLYLPRRDLKSLLFVPNPLSRVASQLLFRQLDLHFSPAFDHDYVVEGTGKGPWAAAVPKKEQENRSSRRTADILTRIIVDPAFAGVIRSLRIFALRLERDGSMAFQTGILANALPRLHNLRHLHVSANVEGAISIFKILQNSCPRLRGISLHVPDGHLDLSNVEFHHISHFKIDTASPIPVSFLTKNQLTLRTVSLENCNWTFPIEALSIRNLTHINFFGRFPVNCQTIPDILNNGRQLESLALNCILDCAPSSQFRALLATVSPYSPCLPFLRHFSFTVSKMNPQIIDRDLYPAVSDLLRDRKQLKTLQLTVQDDMTKDAVGFDASIWGVLPTLTGLKGLVISYPKDLAPGLASWLIPRSVEALSLDGVDIGLGAGGRVDPIPFLSQLRPGIPPTLKKVSFDHFPVRKATQIVEHGFPMVRVLRLSGTYYTVVRKEGEPVELEIWPERRTRFQRVEWLEWLGCSEGLLPQQSDFPAE